MIPNDVSEMLLLDSEVLEMENPLQYFEKLEKLDASQRNAVAYELGVRAARRKEPCYPWSNFQWGMMVSDKIGFSQALLESFMCGWGEEMK